MAPLVSRGGRPGPLRPGPATGLGGLAALSEPSALTGAGRSGRSVRGRSGRSVRRGLSDAGRSVRAAPSPSGERGAPLPLSSPCEGPPGRWEGRAGRRGPPWSSRRLSEPGSPRSGPLRERPPASCVVTPAVTGRSISSMRFASEVFSTTRGGSTETTVMPSMPNSASARTTSPAFAPPYRRAASSEPRGFSAPAARQVQVPSGRALVSSISMRRATAPKYNFGAAAQIMALRAGWMLICHSDEKPFLRVVRQSGRTGPGRGPAAEVLPAKLPPARLRSSQASTGPRSGRIRSDRCTEERGGTGRSFVRAELRNNRRRWRHRARRLTRTITPEPRLVA